MALTRVGSVVIAVALAATPTSGAQLFSQDPIGGTTPSRAVILLANGTLAAVSVRAAKVLHRLRVESAPERGVEVGNYLGLSNDKRFLFVLEPRPPVPTRPKPQSIAVVSVASLQVVRRYPLPSDVLFRSLVVGPRTGRLYIAGNRLRDGRTALGARQEDAVVALFDSRDGELLAETTTRAAAGHNWFVLASAISQDEQHLFISYHGDDTTGADWLSVSDTSFARCSVETRPDTGCLNLHGNIATYNARLLATGAGGLILLGLDGNVLRTWSIGLPRDHVMWFALQSRTLRVAATGSCGYVGGLSIVDLARDKRTVLGYPSRKLCGERVAWMNASVLAIARNPIPLAMGQPSALLLFDLHRPREIRAVRVPAEVIDIVSVRA